LLGPRKGKYTDSGIKPTGSPQALQILQNWDNVKQHFIQIMPIEYKKTLAAQKKLSNTIAS
jgi:glutamate synthase domain-containing protein 3